MKHCLIVDDSRVIRQIATRICEGLNLVPAEAEDGVSALEACRRAMPDVILLDGHMPNMTGADFLRALRREENGARPVVLFCTSENDPAQIGEALNAGANEYLMKPFDLSSVRAKMGEMGLL